jgi:hypothetical protein
MAPIESAKLPILGHFLLRFVFLWNLPIWIAGIRGVTAMGYALSQKGIGMKVFAVILSFALLINIVSSLSTAVAQTAVGQAKAKTAETATAPKKSSCPRFNHSRACY